MTRRCYTEKSRSLYPSVSALASTCPALVPVPADTSLTHCRVSFQWLFLQMLIFILPLSDEKAYNARSLPLFFSPVCPDQRSLCAVSSFALLCCALCSSRRTSTTDVCSPFSSPADGHWCLRPSFPPVFCSGSDFMHLSYISTSVPRIGHQRWLLWVRAWWPLLLPEEGAVAVLGCCRSDKNWQSLHFTVYG